MLGLRWFVLALTMLAGLGVTLQLLYGKVETHLLFNRCHTPIFDLTMPYITFIGDAAMFIVANFFVIRRDRKFGWRMAVAGIVTGAMVIFLKQGVFASFDRPSLVLVGHNLHLINGVNLYKHNSFPSGHAAMAFCMVTSLALWQRKEHWEIVWLLVGLLAAYSRVYLSQHFFIDIVAGAWLGFGLALATFVIWEFQSQRRLMAQ